MDILNYFNGKINKTKEIEVKDFIARIFCHEIDHLDGILFYDKEFKK